MFFAVKYGTPYGGILDSEQLRRNAIQGYPEYGASNCVRHMVSPGLHGLSLAVGDSIKSVACSKGVFEVLHEICKLIKKSLKRNTKLDEMRKQSNNDPKGIRDLCPTRSTVHGEALESILNNYDELMNLWGWSIDTLHDTELKARIRGVQANMPTFDVVYGCSLRILLLKQTDDLSRALQDSKM